MLNADPVHMKPNICSPILALIFKSGCEVATLRKITAMTVAMMVAAVVSRAAMNVQIAKGKDHHLDFRVMGAMNIERKFMHMPVR